jgi:hypothetical protein
VGVGMSSSSEPRVCRAIGLGAAPWSGRELGLWPAAATVRCTPLSRCPSAQVAAWRVLGVANKPSTQSSSRELCRSLAWG